MEIPLHIAAPAVIAAAAYLNARLSIFYDYALLDGLVKGLANTLYTEYRDRENLFYTLENFATSRKSSEREFLVYEGRSWTYKEAYEITLKYGNWFSSRFKIKPKEIVALNFMNCPEFVFLWLGLWSIGAVPAFINYNLTGHSLLHCVKASTARLLLVDPAVKERLSPHVMDELRSESFRHDKGSVEVLVFDEKLENAVMKLKPDRQPDHCRSGAVADDMATLIYTSGTTGMPKPATVAWGKHRVAAVFVANWMKWRDTDRFYSCMPLYHSTASILGFTSCLMRGIPYILGHRFSLSTFWPEVRSSHATIIQYVGETCRYLLSAAPSPLDAENNVRIAFGNGLRPDIWPQFKARFNIGTIAEAYASTEGTLGVFNLSSNSFSQGAIGRNGKLAELVLGRSVAVVELNETMDAPARFPEHGGLCRRAPRGQPGELLYKLPGSDPEHIKRRFQGYFNNPTATQSKILFDVLHKGDAWFRTGDVIRWDTEGRMYFCDRIGDTFRWKSENVATTEVEAALGAFPAVKECIVYGVTIPCHEGRAGCAALVWDLSIVPRSDENSSSKSAQEEKVLGELVVHLRQELPKFAVPVFLRVLAADGLERTGNNKFVKHVLRSDGVDPAKMSTTHDRVFWLDGDTYVPLDAAAWKRIVGGARL